MKMKCKTCLYEMTFDPGVIKYIACPNCGRIQGPGTKYICTDKERLSLESVRGTPEENTPRLLYGDVVRLLKLHPWNKGDKCDCGLFEIERTGHIEYYFLADVEPYSEGKHGEK